MSHPKVSDIQICRKFVKLFEFAWRLIDCSRGVFGCRWSSESSNGWVLCSCSTSGQGHSRCRLTHSTGSPSECIWSHSTARQRNNTFLHSTGKTPCNKTPRLCRPCNTSSSCHNRKTSASGRSKWTSLGDTPAPQRSNPLCRRRWEHRPQKQQPQLWTWRQTKYPLCGICCARESLMIFLQRRPEKSLIYCML